MDLDDVAVIIRTLTAIGFAIATIGFVLLVNRLLPEISSRAQRWRFYALVTLLAAGAYGVAEQLARSVEIGLRSVTTTAGVVVALVALWFSIRENWPR